MPCRSDYMEPTSKEKINQQTAILTLFFMRTLGFHPSFQLESDAKDMYAKCDWAPFLCENLKALKARDPEGFENLVYNAKNPQSRALADWWEKHEAFDKKREAAEVEQANIKALAESARAKLTDEEFEALKKVYK